MNRPNKILIAGGWGYGNLGDDAILLSTVKLLRLKFPFAKITVMTYDCEETKRIFNSTDIEIVPSVHRCLVGNLSRRKFRISSKKEYYNRSSLLALLQKLKAKIDNKILFPKTEKKIFNKFNSCLENLEDFPTFMEFEKADLFVQGGGGYFNDGWIDNVYAHLLELSLAERANLKTMIIGQSIGPFHSVRLKDIIINTLQKVDLISVRDFDSERELNSGGIYPRVIPDTAISDIYPSYVKQGRIAVIVGGEGLNAANIKTVSLAIKRFHVESAIKVVILVSRSWIPDFELADKLNASLVKHGIDSVFNIPIDHHELQEELGKSNLLISQNLHGLILAWRAGVPGISLNGGRKFSAFMSQVKQSERLIPIESLTVKNLYEAIVNADNDKSQISDFHVIMSKKIEKEFLNCLDLIYPPSDTNTFNPKVVNGK